MDLKRLTVIGALIGSIQGFSASALPNLTPTAEANGMKAPIELTLRLFQTRIKVDEPLWGQIELKNIGKKDLTVTDDMFFKPWPIADQSEQKPIYVAVLDAKGRPVKPLAGVYDWHGRPMTRKLSDLNPDEDRKLRMMLDEWKRAGLSKEEIYGNLRKYDDLQNRAKDEAEWTSRNSQIAPGASLKTRPWAHHDRNPNGDEPSTLPVGQFSELKYHFTKPGKYSIHAVYDYRISERMKKLIKPTEMNILVKTKPITFEVIP